MKRTLTQILAAVCIMVCAAACGTDDGPHRDNGIPGGGDNPGTGTIVLRSNPDWTITYDGRQEYEEENGSKTDVEAISLKSQDNEHYYLDIITKDQFENQYGKDLLAYLQDELEIVKQNVSDYNSSFDAETSAGDQTFLFDRMRSGKWRAIAFGVTSGGNLTGDYAVLDFTIKEETPTEDFNKWLGNWKFSGKSKKDGNTDIVYNVNISSSDANYLYTIRGWETGTGLRNDMSHYSIEAVYDRFRGTMVFKGLYLETYTENNNTFDFSFFGNFHYDGSAGFTDMTPGEYTITDYVAIAEAFTVSQNSASIQACGLDFSHNGSIYGTQFTSMQYFDVPHDEDGLYTYNDDVPEFPITMQRSGTKSLTTSALTKPVTKALTVKSLRVGERRGEATKFRKATAR